MTDKSTQAATGPKDLQVEMTGEPQPRAKVTYMFFERRDSEHRLAQDQPDWAPVLRDLLGVDPSPYYHKPVGGEMGYYEIQITRDRPLSPRGIRANLARFHRETFVEPYLKQQAGRVDGVGDHATING